MVLEIKSYVIQKDGYEVAYLYKTHIYNDVYIYIYLVSVSVGVRATLLSCSAVTGGE